jgi:hypothetical protein
MSQLYLQAAQVVELWLARKGGLKTLAFSNKVGKKAAVYSLSVETLKCIIVLSKKIEQLHFDFCVLTVF